MSTDTNETIPMVDVARERLQKLDSLIASADVLVGELMTTISRWEDHHKQAQADVGFARGEVDRLRAELENRPTPDRSEVESLKAENAQLQRKIALLEVQRDEARAELAASKETE